MKPVIGQPVCDRDIMDEYFSLAWCDA